MRPPRMPTLAQNSTAVALTTSITQKTRAAIAWRKVSQVSQRRTLSAAERLSERSMGATVDMRKAYHTQVCSDPLQRVCEEEDPLKRVTTNRQRISSSSVIE